MAKVNEYIPVHYVGRRVPVRLNTGTETLVEQCHVETTNINKIIARYRQTGQLPEHREGRYEDVSNIGEFNEVREHMNAALAAYEELPESITGQFSDAGEFLEYVERQRQAAAILRSDSGNVSDVAGSTGGVSSPDSTPSAAPAGTPPTNTENPV